MPLFLLAALLHAQDLTGSWYGSLNIQGTKLPIVFHVKGNEQGFTSTMDSPNQGAMGIPTDKTSIEGKNITIEAAKFGMVYKGTYQADSNLLKGVFSQGPMSLPLIFLRTPEPKTIVKPVIRPQDPTDFPYKQEEISFNNPKGGNQLSGTLTMPSSGKATKIVVLISGSGPQNRNEEIAQFNHRPFLVWSDWLTRHGIAVLRYDDRGVGKSTGVFNNSTSADFADDAEAAVNYIKSRADLNKLAIGLVGHSEGGMIAPMVASRNASVKFIVLLAGPGIPISKLMIQQNKDVMRLAGAPDSAITTAATLNEKIYANVISTKNLSNEEFKSKMSTFLTAELNSLQAGSPGDLAQQVKTITNQVGGTWYRYFLAFDPAVYLSKVKCPVLAINGTFDAQVASGPNLNGIKESLTKAGHKHFEIVPLEGLNHLLQKSKTGSPNEYGEISETVNPIALQKVSDWINKQ